MAQYWSPTSLAEKVVIVTGAGQGIGRAITASLAERGAAVLAVDLVADTVRSIADELSQRGHQVVAVHEDITAPGAAARIVDAAIAAFGRVDGLVNNAASGHMPTPLQDVTDEQFLTPFHTGPRASFELMQAVHPHMRAAGGGSIVNFGSGAGAFGEPGFAGYGAAKEAIRGLSKVAAMEWGVDGIRVNVVAPAAMTEGMALFREHSPEQFEAMLQKVPMRRVGDPHDDVASVVAFLVGDDSTYLTAQTIMVDGGASAAR